MRYSIDETVLTKFLSEFFHSGYRRGRKAANDVYSDNYSTPLQEEEALSDAIFANVAAAREKGIIGNVPENGEGWDKYAIERFVRDFQGIQKAFQPVWQEWAEAVNARIVEERRNPYTNSRAQMIIDTNRSSFSHIHKDGYLVWIERRVFMETPREHHLPINMLFNKSRIEEIREETRRTKAANDEIELRRSRSTAEKAELTRRESETEEYREYLRLKSKFQKMEETLEEIAKKQEAGLRLLADLGD